MNLNKIDKEYIIFIYKMPKLIILKRGLLEKFKENQLKLRAEKNKPIDQEDDIN